MKLEQIYKNIYETLNVGDKLWADEDPKSPDLDVDFIRYLKKLYAPDFEPNTKDEDELLRVLQDYFYANTGAKDLGKLLKGLVPLKSKFPRLLDPAQSKDVGGSGKPWQSEYEGYAWRGATMPLKDLQRLIPQSRLVGQANEKDPKRIRIDGFAIDDPNFVYKSRGDYGFTSFSLDAYTADNFKGQFEDDRVSVVYGVKLTDPNLIMNPDVSNLLSKYKEYETLYVGDKVKPDVIMVTDRRIKGQFQDDARISKFTDKTDNPNPVAYFDDWKRTAKLQPPSKYVGLNEDTKMKSLYQVYTEIQLGEIGNLEPSKALPFELKYDNTRSITDRESGNSYVDGFQEYTFKLPSGTRMGVILRYEGDGKVRIDFNPIGMGEIPVLGDTYKSAYTIMNTVGTIVKQSLKDTLEKGKTTTLVTVGKNEYGKKNPEQRQQLYTLFIKKAFPGAVIHKSGMFTKLPDDYTKYLNENEVYTEIQLSEVGEGTSEPFEYKENFRKGNTFSYLIDAYTEQDDLERSIPIRLQGISFRERVSDDMEIDREEYFNFLDKPKGTIIDGYEIIFSIADAKSGDTFSLVNDKVYMFRLMATIKKILQSEFASNLPDVLSYSPTKEGSEATEDTGRHKLYSIFIKKAFPNAKMFINDEDEEIYFKLK